MFEYLWKIKALPSAQFIAWRVLVNSIASKDNLERRGVAAASNLCCFCGVKVETTKPIFFCCIIVWLVWNQCYAWLELVSVDHYDSIPHFMHFKISNVVSHVNVVWGSV